ncbi:helix-turn-helix domain-containing protein [Saccharicrinis sp. 156]|uniref:helix-turn-helix domain-containing protein n=1 Tax=Saccharicrinis sp. 156 TaxID=3417574 RepID=UPI003D329D4E
MSELSGKDKEFLDQLNTVIVENLSSDQFGVAELASKIGMSRSNLLRKIKKIAKVSVSKYISQVRLHHAHEILEDDDLTVSEVSYRVGFGSTSYFIKCFREQYGYPPGEVRNKSEEKKLNTSVEPSSKKGIGTIMAGFVLVVITIGIIYMQFSKSDEDSDLEKTIAVLPFKNQSADSLNVHFVNGMMESVLNNLQKIKGLKVVSRTSVEKYRNTNISIPEIAKDLKVSYFVEGSGQKNGDQILLSVQLVRADKDKQVWSEQYIREVQDIFQLQMEVAKHIAEKIEVVITPDEKRRIEKVPTENIEAYDVFLKGLDHMHKGTKEGLDESIKYFDEAIRLDPAFSRAYANVAIAKYYLDIFSNERENADEINYYADKALLYDAHLPQSLMSKAYYYMYTTNYAKAVPFLEKALEYNPNSLLIINTISDLYATYLPNSGKYLKYALKGMELDFSAQDSVSTSIAYLHIGNAFIQNGFVPQAERFTKMSLKYNPDNIYSKYLGVFIKLAKSKDFHQTKEDLLALYEEDVTRLDVLQETAKICYHMRNYDESAKYYQKFIEAKQKYDLSIYPGEDMKMAKVFYELGLYDKADSLADRYFEYATKDKSIYKNLSFTAYYSHHGNASKAIEHLKKFSEVDDIQYWVILFLEDDPLMENIKHLPECKKLFREIESNFNENHNRLKSKLRAEGLI